MRDDTAGAGRRQFLRLVGGVASVGVGLPAATGAASARTTAWERTYRHEDEASELTDIARTRDGGYVAVGSTYPVLDEANTWVVKLDADGDAEWNRAYDADPTDQYDNDFGSAVAAVSDGYVVATRDGESGSVRVLALDGDGDVTRDRRFDRTESSVDGGVDVVAVPDGDGGDGVAVLASSHEDGDGDVWLLRLDAELGVRWERTYGGGADVEPVGLVRPADGGYAFAATETSESGVETLSLGRVDDCGRLCWRRTYDGAEGDTNAAGLAERRRGGRTAGYAVAGTNHSEAGWALRAVTAAPDGSVRAARTFDGRYAVGSDVVAVNEGYALLASASPQEEDTDLLLTVVDDGLDVRWREFYGGSSSYDHIEYGAALTYADGKYGLAGSYLSGGDFDTAQGYVVEVVDEA